MDTKQNEPSSLLTIIIQIASVWILSDIGYYIFLPAFGFGGGYSADPVVITIYYMCWLAFATFSFWDLLSKWKPIENRFVTYFTLMLFSSAVVAYLIFILPHFPPLSWSHTWKPASELLIASPWYFLPKSIDIMLQQLLVLAMIHSFTDNNFSLKETSFWCAGLFGGAHILLFVGGATVIHTIVFTVSAFVAGFIFPYLMLKVRNGLIYSYFLHWLFYAVVIVLARVIFSV